MLSSKIKDRLYQSSARPEPDMNEVFRPPLDTYHTPIPHMTPELFDYMVCPSPVQVCANGRGALYDGRACRVRTESISGRISGTYEQRFVAEAHPTVYGVSIWPSTERSE